MANIKARLEGQLLTITNQEVISSGDVNIDRCEFQFDENWQGYTKTAVFYQEKDAVQYVVLDADDSCAVPAAAMNRQGNMHMGVFGVDGPKLITSTVEDVYIHRGAIEGDVNLEPTDDIFLAIIAQYQRLSGMMAEYVELAEKYAEEYKRQNELLENLNAFEVDEVMQRIAELNSLIGDFRATVKSIEDREFLIRDVEVEFNADGEFRLYDERVRDTYIVDVYFTADSLAVASSSIITAESMDGYILMMTSKGLPETVNANILVRRY